MKNLISVKEEDYDCENDYGDEESNIFGDSISSNKEEKIKSPVAVPMTSAKK